MMTRILCYLSLLAASGLSPAILSGDTAERQGAIRGVVFISPSGKLEGDLVMRGAGIQIMLLRGEEGFEADLAALRQNRTPTIDKQLQAVNRAQEQYMRAVAGQREEMEHRSSALRQERAKLAELREAYATEAQELIAKHTIVETKTDAQGKFALVAVPSGHYFVYAHFEILGMGIHYYWLLPVALESDREIEISLNKLNAQQIF